MAKMTHNEFMMDSLSKLLKEGETLKCPFYGILNQANETFFCFFGLVNNDLLVAVRSDFGQNITYSTRVPLDVKSVKVKTTLILHQRVIDISFFEGSPCRITASPKIIGVGSQLESLNAFIDHLFDLIPRGNKPVKLTDIDGVRIRRQYFNVYNYLLLPFLPMLLVMITILNTAKNGFILSEFTETVFTSFLLFGVAMLPFFLLSLLNKFLFGKTVCVLTEDGIHLENDFIPWKEITAVNYSPRISLRSKIKYTYATLTVKREDSEEFFVDIMSFPRYGLKKIKNYAPEIEVKLSKGSLFGILLFALLPTAIGLLVSLWNL